MPWSNQMDDLAAAVGSVLEKRSGIPPTPAIIAANPFATFVSKLASIWQIWVSSANAQRPSGPGC